MLKVEGLSTHYGEIVALSDISLSVQEGEIVALVGNNGAGKSTLLRTISGLVKPIAGKILLEEKDIVGLPAERIAQMGIRHAPEGRRVFPRSTVLENLIIGAYTRRDPAGIAADLEHLFEIFPILKKRERQAAGTLSGGEQQMLSIARAAMGRPKLLMLDEPSLGLAPQLVTEIFRILVTLNRQGTTILLVEQNSKMALEIADRAYVLETGRIVITGKGEDLLNDDNVRRAYMGG